MSTTTARTRLPAMDPRVRARRIEVARSHGRRRFRRIVALAVVTALVLAALAISRSPLLDVDHVAVRGGVRSGEARVRTAAGIDVGRAMTSVDLGAAVQRVERLPWVARASVVRRWPGTVQVSITERTPVAIVGTGASAVVVDRDGWILGPVGDRDRGLPDAGPDPVEGPGAMVPAEQRPVLAVLAELPEPLRSEVVEGVGGSGRIGLVLRDGIEVRLGDATRLQAKADAVEVLLARAGRRSIATIEVGS